MIDLEPPSRFYQRRTFAIVLAIWGGAVSIGVSFSPLQKIVVLMPLSVFIFGMFATFANRRILFDSKTNEISFVLSIWGWVLRKRIYHKDDFDCIVVDKTDNDGDVYGFMITISGKYCVKLGYISTKENILDHAKYLKNILDLPIEDWEPYPYNKVRR